MSRMDEAMQELVDAIKFSEEYIRYQDIKNRVHNQPQLEQHSIERIRRSTHHYVP